MIGGLLVTTVALATCWKKEAPPEPESAIASTWSGFHDYKRLQMLLHGFAIQSIADVPSLDFNRFRFEELLDRVEFFLRELRYVAR